MFLDILAPLCLASAFLGGSLSICMVSSQEWQTARTVEHWPPLLSTSLAAAWNAPKLFTNAWKPECWSAKSNRTMKQRA